MQITWIIVINTILKKKNTEKSADIAVNKKVLFCYYSKDVHLKFHDWRHEGRG